MSTFLYGIGQGFKGLFQNKIFTLAAIGTVTACLFLFGVFFAVLANFREMIYQAETTVGITVFFDEGLTENGMEYVGSQIKVMDGVDSVEFISAEEAWENFKKDKLENNQELIETFGDSNPLKDSASYVVKFSDLSKEEDISNAIKKIDGVRKVNSPEAVTSHINSFNMLIAYVSVTIIALLILVSIFLISSAVAMGINVRKDEIAIMKLIGATDTFVKLPFIIEGIIIGIVGAAIPLVLIFVLYNKAIDYIAGHFPTIAGWLSFIEPGQIFGIIIPVCAVLGIGIGLIGSSVSVRKHLKI
ncbi:MAG: permease-like cell division protein FtsX [Lachnospiraceae bacterium]|nr:permease-like cell division protein FtsX [Lachnospiraceae bacterium]